jgi:hypothetical protein
MPSPERAVFLNVPFDRLRREEGLTPSELTFLDRRILVDGWIEVNPR